MSDPGCACRDFEESLSLTVTKSPVWASYPMQYLTSFNYKPYEAIVRPDSEICSVGCGVIRNAIWTTNTPID